MGWYALSDSIPLIKEKSIVKVVQMSRSEVELISLNSREKQFEGLLFRFLALTYIYDLYTFKSLNKVLFPKIFCPKVPLCFNLLKVIIPAVYYSILYYNTVRKKTSHDAISDI